ncbi:hypothetical protein GGTG_06724 [Gaeumannomyces tritici R3-111a-1]|uniref:Uncharacterized protein n=1 Tax=Gaeumannomyces tritici (strain R3-111a-1) TaxID=644352 RepID=J3NZM7_GAET3|nr:hypothetical protein GGTG_06724 [Gaeumannomyces tritici R3-111a-1]EJT76810.1 hypothetical protein GGTG_06724 [Gaeumannomyces tritici R3-111a-1]
MDLGLELCTHKLIQYAVSWTPSPDTLVATCVLARKARWLRDACIAAALLLPAVAALHGIVLAKMHVDGGYCPKQRAHETSTTLKSLSHLAAWMQSGPLGRPAARAGRQGRRNPDAEYHHRFFILQGVGHLANTSRRLRAAGAVDLDVYGAFQLSSIAILAAPVTLRRSTTYFDGPGRNIIFVWTAILLAGMLSLAVELFRSNPVPCAANNITAANFPYGEKASGLCGIQCSQELGPFSTMRQGATGEIYVIPAPKLFEFGTATLLAAGCCIISILSLVDIFNKIRHDNRKRHAREKDGATEDQDNSDGDSKDLSEGQPEATISGTNGATQSMMENAETRAKFLMGAVEIPLFAAAILAILVIGERNFMSPELSHGTEPMENVGQWAPIVTAGLAAIGSLYLLGESNLRKWRIKNKWKLRRRLSNATATTATTAPTFFTRRQSSATCAHCQGHLESPTDVRSDSAVGPPDRGGAEPTSGSRDRINEALSRFADILGTANPGQKSFREGPAADFPETPGERFKNSKFQEAKSKYDDISRDRLPSRAPSIRTAMYTSAFAFPLPVSSCRYAPGQKPGRILLKTGDRKGTARRSTPYFGGTFAGAARVFILHELKPYRDSPLSSASFFRPEFIASYLSNQFRCRDLFPALQAIPHTWFTKRAEEGSEVTAYSWGNGGAACVVPLAGCYLRGRRGGRRHHRGEAGGG